MTWLLKQNLSRIEIPTFNGSPSKWVEFLIKFKKILVNSVYLSNSQKLHYLQQHVPGIAKRAILGFSNDERRCIPSLKRLNYKFEQKSCIPEAHLNKITKGKQIENDDDKCLTEFFFSLNDCFLITLCQLNFESNIDSAGTLCQTICRLPYLSKQGYKYNQNTGVDTRGINPKKENKPFEYKCILCQEKYRI